MVNIDDFIKRLEIILDYYSLNASAFADKIGVQRSSLSHLLSGRNKPSLDFVLKILEEFPEIDLYWILNGKGQFPKSDEESLGFENKLNDVSNNNPTTTFSNTNEPNDLFSEPSVSMEEKTALAKETVQEHTIPNLLASDVEKIIFFYKDGTFKTYKPK
ncbi:helix-turn-helix domain-containing protein [Flavobacterium sp.]|uniref:helix-turn-helix domain-containing protein n=1 Tax=Flavobacterium sp. TaxID=239 RepID=UPI003C37632A